jgi:hypothetical protein
VDVGDFMLTPVGVSGATIANVSGSDATYSVRVNTGSGNGTLRLDVRATANIADLAGNLLGNLPFPGNEFYTIRKMPASGAGMYDDSRPEWVYSPGWTTKTASNAVGGTIHSSSTEGSTAAFLFRGPAFFTLFYRMGPQRGTFEVWVDGVKHKTINAYRATAVWQTKYTSPAFTTAGDHEVVVKNISPTGTYIDVDAIEITLTPTPAGVGIYDDIDVQWIYSSGWTTKTGSTGPLDGTFHLTSTRGATATFVFQAPARFTLYYRTGPSRGTFAVWVDGVKIATINAYNATTVWQQTYISPEYTDGRAHTVVIRNNSPIGKYIDVDAIQIE